MTEYIHKVYGTAWALIRNPDRSVREATPAELEKLENQYATELQRSFLPSRIHEADLAVTIAEGSYPWPHLVLPP